MTVCAERLFYDSPADRAMALAADDRHAVLVALVACIREGSPITTEQGLDRVVDLTVT